MKRDWHIRSIAAALLAFAPCLDSTAVVARDLERSDRDRIAILNAARPRPSDKFLVKDLIKDQGFAYLCGLIRGPKGLMRKNGRIAVYQFILRKDTGHWLAINMAESGM